MNLINPTVIKVDDAGWQRGFELIAQFSQKTPAQACNGAGYSIALDAMDETPAVTPDRIDAELDIEVTPVIGVRGKPLKGKKHFFAKVGTSSSENQLVPMAVLIIAARARPGSNYNILTNNRYALPSWPFKGIPKAAGAWLMKSLVNKMISARHKSGSFLKAGWLPAIKKLGKSKFKGTIADEGRNIFSLGLLRVEHSELGTATPARDGQTNVTCTGENDIGSEGLNAASMERAMEFYAKPALQRALNAGEKKMQDFLDYSAQGLIKSVNEAAG